MSGENRKLFSVDSHVYIPPEAIRKHVTSTKLDAFDDAVKAYEKYDEDMKQGESLAMEDFVDLGLQAIQVTAKAQLDLKPWTWTELLTRLCIMTRWMTCVFIIILIPFKIILRRLTVRFMSLHLSIQTASITYHLPITDIDFAIEELHRVVQLGARSVQLPNSPSVLGLPDYHDERYDRLFAAIAEAGVVIAHHLTVTKHLWGTFRRDPTPQKVSSQACRHH